MTIGQMIGEYCRAHGMSNQRFAELSGCSKAYVSMVINNRNPSTGKPPVPSLQMYAGFARTMGMTLDELFSKIEDAPVYVGMARRPEEPEEPETEEEPVIYTPDYETPAIKAVDVLAQSGITTAPIFPLQILQATPGVIVVSFTEMADKSGVDTRHLAPMFGTEQQDAITYTRDSDTKYVVAYNQRMPHYMVQMALARELGHIVLGHAGMKQNDAYKTEAMYFARHLLCPRPLIRALTNACIPLSVSLLGNLTGCYGRTLAGIRQIPGAHVPARLNRRVRMIFDEYVDRIKPMIKSVKNEDESGPADFGTYMDHYED